MAIHHLEQKRLIYAKRESDGVEDPKKKEFGSMVKKVPAYIQNNGFLAQLRKWARMAPK